MTEECFKEQMNRLIAEWPKSFSYEKQKLIARALKDLADKTVEKIVTHFLLTCRQAPVPQDFVDAGYRESKRSFDRDVEKAATVLVDWNQQKGLSEYLADGYPGCNSLMEAVEVEIFRLQVKKANEGGE